MVGEVREKGEGMKGRGERWLECLSDPVHRLHNVLRT